LRTRLSAARASAIRQVRKSGPGGCIDPKGYGAGKKISGKKRQILVDIMGLLMHVAVHPADNQDRVGGNQET